MKSEEPFRLIGTPEAGGILIVSDHASNRIPDGIELGIDQALLDQHVALDIGVAEVADRIVAAGRFAAFLGNVSRLVCDFNREADAPGVVPQASDGHAIPGNLLDLAERDDRLERFYRPFHTVLETLLNICPPRLILSLHSFTPHLAERPDEARPWHVGVLYNSNEAPARIAIPLLEAEELTVGDQQPYSGKLLNATMNRHAEAHHRPYLGLEVRQDQIANAAGQALWAERLSRVAKAVAAAL